MAFSDIYHKQVSLLIRVLPYVAEIKVLSFSDIYAGKIVAALDRQHPRDLFDVNQLLENEDM